MFLSDSGLETSDQSAHASFHRRRVPKNDCFDDLHNALWGWRRLIMLHVNIYCLNNDGID